MADFLSGYEHRPAHRRPRPRVYSSGSACTRVDVIPPSGAVELCVDITVNGNTGWLDGAISDSLGVNRTTLPHCTVVISRFDTPKRGDYPTEWLSVRRQSNTIVQFKFGNGIDVDALVELATAPGLKL